MNSQNDEKWLIKSSGRLLGPFSTSDVEEKLKTREIVPLDELISPMGRWHYVADEPTFAALARSMKDDEVEERTMTATIESSGDDLTDTVDISTIETLRKGGFREDVVAEINEAEKVKTYGFQSDRNIEKEAVGRSKWLLPVGICIVLLSIAAVFFLRTSSEDKKNPSYLVRRGKMSLEFGEPKKALDFFIRALRKDGQNTEAILALVPMMAQYEKNFELARQLLLKLKAKETHSAEVFTLQGLVALLDLQNRPQVEEADKWTERALALTNRRFVPALVNKIAILSLRRDYGAIERVYDEIQNLDPYDGASTMLAVMANIDRFKETGSIDYRQKATDLIRGYLERKQDYRQEMLIAQNYIDFVLGGQGNPKTLAATLDMDPYLTKFHHHDMMTYRSHLEWSNLIGWCREIYNSAPKLVRAEALYAFCLIKNKQPIEAGKVLSSALKKSPNDYLISAVQSYFLIETQNENKGLRLLKHISKNQPYDLALFLLGHHCSEISEDCTERTWDILLERNNTNLAAIAGSAENALLSDDGDRARELINIGSRISPNYSPLKKIRWKLEHGVDVE